MKFKLALSLMVLMLFVSANFAQTEITIKKKTSMKMPGMPAIPAEMKNPLDGMNNRTSTVYMKGARMRTDTKFEAQKATGGKETVTQTMIIKCDEKRQFQFSSKKKKYYVDATHAPTSANLKNSKKGGYVTVTGSVTDTGERAKLFGYEARHLKETITFTPSKDACLKEPMQIEIEGWYADEPAFSCCPRDLREYQPDKNCFDQIDFQMKSGITGIALKEVKKITSQGMTMIVEEEVTEMLKTPLADTLFEPPANYKAAMTLKEVEDDSAEESSGPTNETISPTTSLSNNPSPSFALPAAGIEKPLVTDKKSGIIRIGIAKPKVTTPDSKKDPLAGSDVASAISNLLVESLKAENVEGVQLDTDFPENEAKEKGCDHIFYTNVTQKRGGGGFLKQMIVQGTVTMAGSVVPGFGGLIASTVGSQVMEKIMSKNAKAKDEFTFDYKVVGPDKNVLSQAVTKSKTDKDGEDVITPQLVQAAKTVLGKLKK